jgi:hypothetical protein
VHPVAGMDDGLLGAERRRQRQSHRSQRRSHHRRERSRGGHYAGHHDERRRRLHPDERPGQRHARRLLPGLQDRENPCRQQDPHRRHAPGGHRRDRRRDGRGLRYGQEGVVHRFGRRRQGRRTPEARRGQRHQIVRRNRSRRAGRLRRRPAGRSGIGHHPRHRVGERLGDTAIRGRRHPLRRVAQRDQPRGHRDDDRAQGRIGRCALRRPRSQRRHRHHDQEGQEGQNPHFVQGQRRNRLARHPPLRPGRHERLRRDELRSAAQQRPIRHGHGFRGREPLRRRQPRPADRRTEESRILQPVQELHVGDADRPVDGQDPFGCQSCMERELAGRNQRQFGHTHRTHRLGERRFGTRQLRRIAGILHGRRHSPEHRLLPLHGPRGRRFAGQELAQDRHERQLRPQRIELPEFRGRKHVERLVHGAVHGPGLSRLPEGHGRQQRARRRRAAAIRIRIGG